VLERWQRCCSIPPLRPLGSLPRADLDVAFMTRPSVFESVGNDDHLCRPYACGHPMTQIKVGLSCAAVPPLTDGELFPKHRSRAWILSSGLCHYARAPLLLTSLTSPLHVVMRCRTATGGHDYGSRACWDHKLWMSNVRTIISLHLHSTLPVISPLVTMCVVKYEGFFLLSLFQHCATSFSSGNIIVRFPLLT
jgi:hypothetical protein